MTIHTILKMGDPRLLRHAQPVTRFDTPELHQLVADLQDTMVAANGAIALLTEQIAPHLLVPPVNVLRLAMHPDGLAPQIVNYEQWRSYILHRLDRDTSGCLLLARNPKALKRFAAAFEARQVDKRYLGIVAGELGEDAGTIDLALAKTSSAAEGWRMIASARGKPSVTHWRRLDVRDGLTLVEFRPETGRTHQIRIHALAGLGAALVGDPVYGTGTGATRTMLHAAGLTLDRGAKPPIVALAPLPADFTAFGFSDG